MKTNNEIIEIITSRRQELGLSLSEIAKKQNSMKYSGQKFIELMQT